MEKPEFIQDLGMRYATEKSNQKSRFGIFKCPLCGQLFETSTYSIQSGNTKSCGCRYADYGGESKTSLGACHKDMVTRCYKPKSCNYERYGGRGITVCNEWRNDYFAFKKWALQNGFEPGLQIDRIDNNGNYEPSNCRWVTGNENKQNTRLLRSDNTVGYRGVYYHKNIDRYRASIGVNGKMYSLKYYKTPEEAALAYNRFVIEHGTHHPLNIIPQSTP